MINGIANGWIWLGFSVFLVIILGIDGYVLNKRRYKPNSLRGPLLWVLVWIGVALLFNLGLWLYLLKTTSAVLANQHALNFLTGYLVEKSLSIDNLFMFYVIFSQFRIPLEKQQRVLSYGIWSAVVLRLLLILVGSWLISRFHWILYVMGAFLLVMGIKMISIDPGQKNLLSSKLSYYLKKFFRVTNKFQGNRFFITKNKLFYLTPLFIALIFIEFSDIVFAIDSIPAIFAITTDPFIVWTSNVFAIVGLRALYFLLAGMTQRFYLLKYAMAAILIFIGLKMLVAPWISISALVSLGVIVGILLLFLIIQFNTKSSNN